MDAGKALQSALKRYANDSAVVRIMAPCICLILDGKVLAGSTFAFLRILCLHGASRQHASCHDRLQCLEAKATQQKPCLARSCFGLQAKCAISCMILCSGRLLTAVSCVNQLTATLQAPLMPGLTPACARPILQQGQKVHLLIG